MLARKSREDDVYCSVVCCRNGPDRWLMGQELVEFVNRHKSDNAHGVNTVDAAFEVLDKDRVRAYTGGIPQVFGEGADVRGRLKEMIYPERSTCPCSMPECREQAMQEP